ncbi:MAG: peptidoglycan DD-metalloendopeptidase family protein [Methylovulum sp.]|uniref:murein hydrolase activator EnvC family protein n=1 Tax=Methylovulum sp. TaxID=1916980 RepID=UPI0026170E1C|nr:peptidoglycan DD-metalloendopeptidase family protein [Methylovulum sp.]MDD2724591.1 peptidoglycan DD-metalloendopeptidase family protein [Methylovulum sp.]MDD5125760.1 peptidoglycan DD-metalloendopeptidase family protein [Methylovulum sp.]
MKNPIVWSLLLSIWLQHALAVDQAGTGQQQGQYDDQRSVDSSIQEPSSHLPQDNLEQLLADVEKRYGETAFELRSLERQIDQKRRNIDKIELDILKKQRAIAKERKDLTGQVKAAYQMGQQEELKLLLNQQDPALSSRMMIYYSYINKARMAKIAQLEESIADLEQLNKQRQTETVLLEQNIQQKKLQQSALNEVRKQRNELLADTAATSYEEQLRYLAESENKLRNLIASLPQELGIKTDPVPIATTAEPGSDEEAAHNEDFPDLQGSFDSLKGKLRWPVQGKLVRNFNNLQTEGMQSGVLIEAKEGLDVHAVAAGKVTFADWMRSYGYLVIIDHGDGYMSLYAFNQSLNKQVNDTVKAGEVIATVGQSGGRSRPGLYFGIRKKAVPVNPTLWCRSD